MPRAHLKTALGLPLTATAMRDELRPSMHTQIRANIACMYVLPKKIR